jgi:hypothetical protein
MFRLLEGLEEDEDAWETVGKDSKKKAKQQQPQASSSANGGASTSSAASRPAHNSSITNSTAHLRSLKESALNSIKQPEVGHAFLWNHRVVLMLQYIYMHNYACMHKR